MYRGVTPNTEMSVVAELVVHIELGSSQLLSRGKMFFRPLAGQDHHLRAAADMNVSRPTDWLCFNYEAMMSILYRFTHLNWNKAPIPRRMERC